MAATTSDALTTTAIELLASTDPHEIRSRLVQMGLRHAGADRCTLTSVDDGLFRVEDSVEATGRPVFVGKEYPLAYLQGQPLIAEAISSGHVVLGGSLASGGRTAPELTAHLEEVQHSAIVPLKLGQDVGAIFILSRRDGPAFDMSRCEELRQVGSTAVLSLRNARLLEGVTAAQRRGLDALTLISENVLRLDQPTAFFGEMSRSVAGLAGARRVAYWIVDDDHLVAQPNTYGFPASDVAAMRAPLSALRASGVDRVLHEGAALHLPASSPDDVAACPIAPQDVRSLLAVPWRTSQGPLGILVAYDSLSIFTDQDEWIVRLSARASALVWQAYTAQRRLGELRNAEVERLRQHAERMADVERQKLDFLKLASHELGGPITILRGYLSMLRDGTLGEPQPGMEPAVATMETQVTRIKELVDQMLSAVRLEQSELPVKVHDIRIDNVVRDVVGVTQAVRDGPWHFLIEADAPAHASADRHHVETILTNLLSNALKYSPEGGDIVTAVRETGDVVEVDVRDQGIGIGATDFDRLFRPFSRLDDADTHSIEGVGLGLYLARELARVQGGDIRVRSKPGQGSVFTLRLPRRRDGDILG